MSGLVAKNCPNFIKVVPIPSSAIHSFSPGDLELFIHFFSDPIEIRLKNNLIDIGIL